MHGSVSALTQSFCSASHPLCVIDLHTVAILVVDDTISFPSSPVCPKILEMFAHRCFASFLRLRSIAGRVVLILHPALHYFTRQPIPRSTLRATPGSSVWKFRFIYAALLFEEVRLININIARYLPRPIQYLQCDLWSPRSKERNLCIQKAYIYPLLPQNSQATPHGLTPGCI